MLINTFCHIPSVGSKKEIDLWRQGIFSWLDYRKYSLDTAWIDESENQLAQKNIGFFFATLPNDQHWRLVPNFRYTIAYIDIETNGLSRDYSIITTIALYDGKAVHTYVNGKNLKQFVTDIQKYSLLVTFNGKSFDIPFIERYFGINLNHAHIDLRYLLKDLGLTGGLKVIEQKLGMDRAELRSVDGFFAVKLWQEYKRTSNERALETLLAYNCVDVINLEYLLLYVFNKNIERTPFADQKIAYGSVPVSMPFQVDSRLLDRLG